MARCFVVSLVRGGIKFYFKREDEPKGAGVEVIKTGEVLK